MTKTVQVTATVSVGPSGPDADTMLDAITAALTDVGAVVIATSSGTIDYERTSRG